jgi:hypothetical protein
MKEQKIGKLKAQKAMNARFRAAWSAIREDYRKWAHAHPEPKGDASRRHIRIKAMPGCGQNRANSPCDVCPAGEDHVCPNRTITVGFVK